MKRALPVLAVLGLALAVVLSSLLRPPAPDAIPSDRSGVQSPTSAPSPASMPSATRPSMTGVRPTDPADLPPSEEREARRAAQEVEAEMAQESRTALFASTIQNLHAAAEAAEADGRPEQAALMRQRAAGLAERQEQEQEQDTP